jgi:hypothetical protein
VVRPSAQWMSKAATAAQMRWMSKAAHQPALTIRSRGAAAQGPGTGAGA